MKRSKKVTVFLLAAAMVLTTATSYVFWSSGAAPAAGTESVTGITIGAGTEAVTTIDFDSVVVGDSILVPTGITPGAGETNTVTFTVDVDWNSAEFADGIAGTLAVNPATTNLAVGSVGDEALFTMTPRAIPGAGAIAVGGAPVTVTFDVTMERPQDQAQFERIAGEDLAVTLGFTVTPTA